MDIKITSPKSLLESVKKDLADSSKSPAFTAPTRRIVLLGMKKIGAEVSKAKKAIGAMDISKDEKTKLDKQVASEASKTLNQFKSLLGVNK